MNKKSIVLTDREYKVMDVLWNHEKALTINEIAKFSSDQKITVASIAQVIPRLLKKEVIHVENFIPVNTKYARTFLADITREEYMAGEIQGLFHKTGIRSLLSTLIQINNQDDNDKLFRDLKIFIQEYEQTRKDESS